MRKARAQDALSVEFRHAISLRLITRHYIALYIPILFVVADVFHLHVACRVASFPVFSDSLTQRSAAAATDLSKQP